VRGQPILRGALLGLEIGTSRAIIPVGVGRFRRTPHIVISGGFLPLRAPDCNGWPRRWASGQRRDWDPGRPRMMGPEDPEVGGQRSEIRSQKSEDRGQRAVSGLWVPSWKTGVTCRKQGGSGSSDRVCGPIQGDVRTKSKVQSLSTLRSSATEDGKAKVGRPEAEPRSRKAEVWRIGGGR
jgi:hypothetical protein